MVSLLSNKLFWCAITYAYLFKTHATDCLIWFPINFLLHYMVLSWQRVVLFLIPVCYPLQVFVILPINLLNLLNVGYYSICHFPPCIFWGENIALCFIFFENEFLFCKINSQTRPENITLLINSACTQILQRQRKDN